MAYGNKVTPAAGTSLPFDDIGQSSFPRNKLALGGEGEAVDAVGGAGPTTPGTLRTVTASDDPLVAQLGAVNETAPATDTGAAGLNGRLQRIAQRLTSLIGGIGAGNDAAATDETSNAGLVALTKGLLRDLRARLGAVNDAAWSSGPGSINALLKTIATQAADTTTPSPITRGGTILGYQTLTSTLSGSVALPSIPAGAKSVMLAAEGQNVRFNPTGTATATSFPIIAGQPAYEFPGTAASLAAARAIQQTAGATLHIFYVG